MPLFTESQTIYEKAIAKQICDSDLDTVISWPEKELSLLFAATDQIRRHFHHNMVDPCAIMNIKSGGCSEDCAFCTQSAHNTAAVNVQKLSDADEIIAHHHQAHAHGLKFGVVSSGKRLTREQIITIAEALKSCNDHLHASLGLLGDEEFAILRDAGVVCYNHNLETSKRFFPRIVTTHTWEQRVETVKRAKKAGMAVCSGGIFGLGEQWQDRKELALELARLDVDTIPINFLNAIPGTRIGKPAETPLDFLKIVALFRIALPDKNIKVCGGREINLGRLQPLMFYAGANGYISGDYLTTSGDRVESDDALVASLGLQKQGEQNHSAQIRAARAADNGAQSR
ncbi:MAG: biotin synthase BioB [Chitinivibrionales bacterium]|nr:biotin synthase BioB [Chitinivibrionales bacterium]